jgi:hypothetical protein
LNPVNQTTVLRERSLSPNMSVSETYKKTVAKVVKFLSIFMCFQSNKIYKTSKYEYSTASSGGYGAERGNSNEINKLDTLLNDLEHERTATLDRSTIESFL